MSVFGKKIAPLRARNKLFSETPASVSYSQDGSERDLLILEWGLISKGLEVIYIMTAQVYFAFTLLDFL